MGARWVDPALSHWLSADTLVPEPGKPQAFNRYSYVYNNPLRYVDPSGYDPLDEAWVEEFKKAHNGQEPTDLDRFWRLYSIAYPGPVSGGWPWTGDDWNYVRDKYLEDDAYSVLKETTHRSSLDDFTATIARIAGWYTDKEKAQFVSAIALLFAGVPYDPTGSNLLGFLFEFTPVDSCEGVTCPCTTQRIWWVNHGMEGFSDLYYLGGNENTHHFAAHLLVGYHLGITWNDTLSMIRELAQGDPDRLHDIRMSQVAGRLGDALFWGRIKVSNFAAVVYGTLRAR